MLPIVEEFAEKLSKLSSQDLRQVLQELNVVMSLLGIETNLKRGCISIEAIQREVAAHFGITLRDLKGSSRLQSIARPRAIAMWLARTLTSLSFPEIGRAFYGKDHSTVICAVKKIGRLLAQDPGLAAVVAGLEGRLRRTPKFAGGEPAAAPVSEGR